MASRYWVGGTSTWNATAGTKWATTSGGAGGAAVPTGSDDVFFDAASGAVTITHDGTRNCNNFDATGFTGTYAGQNTPVLGISGNFTRGSSMTVDSTGAQLTFNANTTGKTLTFNGASWGRGILFNNSSGGWTLQDDLNNLTANVNLTSGSLDTNGKTVTCGQFFSSNTNNRSLTLGASTINCSNWSFTDTTNLTFSAGTSTITTIGTTNTFLSGGLTYYNVTFSQTAVITTMAITGAFTCNNFTITPTQGQQYTFNSNVTINGTFTVTGANNSSALIYIFSSTYRTARTFTAAVCSLTNVVFRDITGAGAGTWSGMTLGNCGGNSGITFTTPKTAYWVNDGTAAHDITDALWFTASGGAVASSYPLPQDTARFDANSFGIGSCTITANAARAYFANMNWTGVTNNPTFTDNGYSYCGDLILDAGMTFTNSSAILQVVNNSTFTSAGLSLAGTLTINGLATVTLGSNLTLASTLTLTGGALDTQNYNVTNTSFVCTGSVTRSLTMGSTTWTLTTTGTVWNMAATGMTLTPGTSTIKFTNSSASSKTFAGAGLTYANFWNATGSTGVCIITGSNTFSNFKIDAGRTQQFTAGTTTTLTTFTATGTIGNVITITSVTTATHTLTKSGGGSISCDYLNISYSIASPATTFYAGVNSTDSGNNTGWVFTNPPLNNISTLFGVSTINLATINGVTATLISKWNNV